MSDGDSCQEYRVFMRRLSDSPASHPSENSPSHSVQFNLQIAAEPRYLSIETFLDK